MASTEPRPNGAVEALPPEPIDRTIREFVGHYERKTPARATVSLTPGDVSPVVLVIGGREFKAKREQGWNVALAKTLATEKSAAMVGAVRGEFLDLVATEAGEGGNEIALAGIGLTVPARPTGGRCQYVAAIIEFDGVHARETVLKVASNPAEALAVVRTKVMASTLALDRATMLANQPKALPHAFRKVAAEEGCAVCGRAKEGHKE